MTQAASRLALLMQLLDITGRELGQALHVDHSLISKWKNNHRRIPDRADMLRRVAEYLLLVDEKKGENITVDLLTSSGQGQEVMTNAEMHERLMAWLRDPAPPDSVSISQKKPDWHNAYSYVCPVEVYQTEPGRREAVLNLFKILMSVPDKTELKIMMQENPSWIDNDPLFSRQLHHQIVQAIKQGHQLQIIHWLGHQGEMVQSLVQEWMPLQMSGRIKSYHYPFYRPNGMPQSLFIIPGHAALQCLSDPQKEERHTLLFRDPGTVRGLEGLYQSYFQDSMILMENHSSKRPTSILPQLIKANQDIEVKPVFIHAELPSLLLQPWPLARKMLNHQHQEEIATIFKTDDPSRLRKDEEDNPVSGHQTVRHVYQLSKIRQACRKAQVTDSFFSALAGKPVQMSHHTFLKLLRQLADLLLKHDHVEIALLNDELYDQVNWPNLLFVHHDLVMAWSGQQNDIKLTARESTLLHGFEIYLENRWQQIPLVCRDRKRIADQLLDLSRLEGAVLS